MARARTTYRYRGRFVSERKAKQLVNLQGPRKYVTRQTPGKAPRPYRPRAKQALGRVKAVTPTLPPPPPLPTPPAKPLPPPLAPGRVVRGQFGRREEEGPGAPDMPSWPREGERVAPPAELEGEWPDWWEELDLEVDYDLEDESDYPED